MELVQLACVVSSFFARMSGQPRSQPAYAKNTRAAARPHFANARLAPLPRSPEQGSIPDGWGVALAAGGLIWLAALVARLRRLSDGITPYAWGGRGARGREWAVLALFAAVIGAGCGLG